MPAAPEPDNAISEEGARRLATRLQCFWHEQGFPAARFWVEPLGTIVNGDGRHIGYAGYTVRSNLLNGVPPKGVP